MASRELRLVLSVEVHWTDKIMRIFERTTILRLPTYSLGPWLASWQFELLWQQKQQRKIPDSSFWRITQSAINRVILPHRTAKYTDVTSMENNTPEWMDCPFSPNFLTSYWRSECNCHTNSAGCSEHFRATRFVLVNSLSISITFNAGNRSLIPGKCVRDARDAKRQ